MDGIQQEDIIAAAALTAPLQLATNMDKAADSYDKIITKTKNLVRENDKQEASIADVTNLLNKLTKQEQTLVDIQNKHATQVAKLTDTQKKQAKEIDNLNKKLKEKKKIDEDSGKAVDALDKATGGLISSMKDLGKQFVALASNPVTLILGALVGTFFALKNAAEIYYKTTGEGEDELAVKLAASDAAFRVLKHRWAEVGKEVAKVRTDVGFWGDLVGAIALRTGIGLKLWTDMVAAATEAAKIEVKNDEVGDSILKNRITRAETESRIAELTTEVGRKQAYTEQQIIDMHKELIKLKEDIMADGITIANQELDQLQKTLALKYQIELSTFKQMTDEQLLSTMIGDDQKALFDARVKLIDLNTEFYAATKKNEAAISTLTLAGIADRKKAAEEKKKLDDKEYERKYKQLQEINKAEIDFQGAVLDDFKANYKSREEIELEDFDRRMAQRDYEHELEMLRRAELKEDLTNILTMAQQFAGALNDLFSTIFSRRSMRLDEESRQIDDSMKAQLARVEGNRLAEERIKDSAAKQHEELEKRKRAETRKTAIYEKAVSFAQAGINIALAITKVLWNPIQVTLTSILGGIQLAAIAAKPIPALFKGTRNFKGGPVTVGERGSELIKIPGQRPMLSPSTTTMTYLPPGTEVLTHEQTRRAMGWDDSRIVGELQRNRPPDFVRIHDDIYEVRRRKNNSRELNRRYTHGHS